MKPWHCFGFLEPSNQEFRPERRQANTKTKVVVRGIAQIRLAILSSKEWRAQGGGVQTSQDWNSTFYERRPFDCHENLLNPPPKRHY